MNGKMIAFLVIVVVAVAAIFLLPDWKQKEEAPQQTMPAMDNGTAGSQQTHQSSAMSPQPDSVLVDVQDSTGTDLAKVVLSRYTTVKLPGTPYSLHMSDFYTHFMMQDGGPANMSPHLENPAARIEIMRDGKLIDYTWTFQKVPYFRMSGMGGSPTAEPTGLAFAMLEVYGLEPPNDTPSNP